MNVIKSICIEELVIKLLFMWPKTMYFYHHLSIYAKKYLKQFNVIFV